MNPIAILICVIIIGYWKPVYNYFRYPYFHYFSISNKLVVLNKKIDEYSYLSFSLKLFDIGKKHNTVYIYIDSPGGSVKYAYEIIKDLQSFKNKTIICIAKTANSAAFSLFQHCQYRYVLHDSELMQHEASYSKDFSLSELNSQCESGLLSLSYEYEQILVKSTVRKIGISYKDFSRRIKKEWRINSGYNILKENLADKVINLYGLPDNL